MSIDIKKLIRYRSLIIGIIVVIAVAIYVGWWAYDRWQTDRLLQHYRSIPERITVVEQLEKDYRDLANEGRNAVRRQSILMDLGLQWYVLGEYDRAVDYWREGLSVAPDNDIGWYNLGNAYLKLKRYRDAERAYRESMRLAGKDEVQACLALGAMYQHDYTKKAAEEPKVYKECLLKSPDNWDLVAALGEYYKIVKDWKNAILQYDKLYSLEPGNQQVSDELRDLRLKLEAQEKQ